MSERKERPDKPGRWWVTRKDGYSRGVIMRLDDDGELYGFGVGPGDKWQNVDALEAELDAAKAAAEQLRQSNANLLENFDAQTKLCRNLRDERDSARQGVERLQKQYDLLAINHDNLSNVSHGLRDKCERLEAELASLRAKGETDKRRYPIEAEVEEIPAILSELFGQLTAFDPSAARGVSLVLHHFALGASAPPKESSRAT